MPRIASVPPPAPNVSPAHVLRPELRFAPFTANLVGMNRLTRADREHLAAIATVQRFKSRTVVCRRGTEAECIYSIAAGAVRSSRSDAHGRRRVLAFLFVGDLFGLAQKGVFVNDVETLAPTTVFRIPVEPLAALLLRDADLQFRFLCKVAHGLRQSQRQALILGSRTAVSRIAIFLSMLEETAGDDREPSDRIALPMTIADIAEYVNLTPPAVRAAFAALEHDGVIDRGHHGTVRVVDRRAFNQRAAAV